VTGSVDGTICIWNTDLEKQHEIAASPLGILSLTANLQNIGASSGLDGIIRVWDLEAGTLKTSLTPTPGVNAYRVACQPNSNNLAATGSTGQIQIWDLATGQQSGHIQTTSSFTTAVSFVSLLLFSVNCNRAVMVSLSLVEQKKDRYVYSTRLRTKLYRL